MRRRVPVASQWEYVFVGIRSPEGSFSTLTELGEKGWEAFAVDNGFVYCKRQIEPRRGVATCPACGGQGCDHCDGYGIIKQLEY